MTSEIALALLLGAAPAGAAADEQTKPKEKLICKMQTSTGFRLATERRCLTREQWDRAAREAGDYLQENRNRRLGSSN